MFSVAIMGATGAVGQELLKLLDERGFPVGSLNSSLRPVPRARRTASGARR
jgi:aspartate-semialdehyde dehydrogenase